MFWKIMQWVSILIFVAALTIAMIWGMAALADDQSYTHAQGHNVYRYWYSQKTGNCCNDQDCHPLKDTEWREDAEGPSVLIRGEWCPVQQQHYVIKGKSPNWEVPHACINDRTANMPPCERLLCFMGTPKG